MVTAHFNINGKTVEVDKTTYLYDNSTCIRLWVNGEPWSTITKCFPDIPHADNEVFLDMNNCREEIMIMRDLGYLEITDMGIRSGYCVYPMARLKF